MARSQSAIMSTENRKASRDEKKALGVQIREKKAELRIAEREVKAFTRELVKLEGALEKVVGKMTKDKAARAAA